MTPAAPGIGVQVLPARTYAVTEHRGAYETLGGTYSRLCGDWLPISGRVESLNISNAAAIALYAADQRTK